MTQQNTRLQEWIDLENRLAKKYKFELVYVKFKAKGMCAYKKRLIMCPEPTTKKNLLIFFHELTHLIFSDNLEQIINNKAKKIMKKELGKLKK